MEEAEIIELVNQIRSEDGLATLVENEFLASAADAKTSDMVENEYFDHLDSYDHDITSLISEDYNYYIIGENLAYGFNSEEALLDAWMKSDSHKDNILYRQYEDTGVGVEVIGDTYMVAQVFGLTQKEYLTEVKGERFLAKQGTQDTFYSIFLASALMFLLVLGFLIRQKVQKRG